VAEALIHGTVPWWTLPIAVMATGSATLLVVVGLVVRGGGRTWWR
jgi:hypothetical protein